MADTKIEWAEKVWNPIAGCTKCSPGCLNCYAERMALRLSAIELSRTAMQRMKLASPYHIVTDKKGWNGKIATVPSRLEEPLHWRKPRRIFVSSMSDLFHKKVPFEFIDKMMATISLCPQHTFLILTKRADRMLEYFTKERMINWNDGTSSIINEGIFPLNNLHLGVSISTPDEMWKAKELSRIPAAVRWISFEPLLADVGEIPLSSLREDDNDLEEFGQHIDWVVVGGESGPGARPMGPDLVRNIRDQCIAANVPFYFKQWGRFYPSQNGTVAVFNKGGFQRDPTGKFDWLKGYAFEQMMPTSKKKAGCKLDSKEWKQLPERRII